jgi:hypothetical protein
MSNDWKNDLSRDVKALGSIVFYLLVVARAAIGPFFPFIYQLLIALVIVYLFSLFVKAYDAYVARALIVATFTTLFYRDLIFGIFAFLVFAALIVSTLHLGSSKGKVCKGILVGIMGVLGGFLIAALIAASLGHKTW